MSETQDLEREIQRLSEIIGASESALKAKAMSASDRAWLTKQLGLRRIRLVDSGRGSKGYGHPDHATIPLEVRTVGRREPTAQDQWRRHG
jgi:hypothetical protein